MCHRSILIKERLGVQKQLKISLAVLLCSVGHQFLRSHPELSPLLHPHWSIPYSLLNINKITPLCNNHHHDNIKVYAFMAHSNSSVDRHSKRITNFHIVRYFLSLTSLKVIHNFPWTSWRVNPRWRGCQVSGPAPSSLSS